MQSYLHNSTGTRRMGKAGGETPQDKPVRLRAIAAVQKMKPNYLRPEDAAKYASIGVRTLYRWISTGKIKPAKIGRVRLVSVADLDRLIQSHQ